jgi:Mrp family chromosome partitioning ATPase/capsular polysaccharide biosynthesis protein
MNETTDAAAIFKPLWKRSWLILAVGILVGALSYVYYRHKTPVYLATTQLYLGNAAEERPLNNTLGKTTLSSTEVTNQVALIQSNVVSEAVHKQLLAEHNQVALHGKTRAKAAAGSDFVTITSEAHGPRAAAQLANAYAQVYVKRSTSDYQRAVKAAIATTRLQIRRIEASSSAAPKGSKKGSGAAGNSVTVQLQAAALHSKINQLESDLRLSGVQQVGPAKTATAQLISPTPKKNAIFGFVIGVALAALAAYALDRVERRLRSLGDVERVFQTQILAVLPRVRTPIFGRGDEDPRPAPRPAQALLEPLRGLHTALQFGGTPAQDGEPSPRVILFLSADAGDGKSTTVANLAIVQRDAGACVAVIEADLRRPVQAGLLSLSAPRGLAEVLAGAVTFDRAMQDAGSSQHNIATDPAPALAGAPGATATSTSTVTPARGAGSLSVLAGGGEAVANPPALLASPAMRELLRSAAADFDYVLIDAPSLQVSDAVPLLGAVDGIVIVTRLEHTREASAERLMALLSRSSTAPVLGVVANAVSRADIRRSGFSTGYGGRRWPRLS